MARVLLGAICAFILLAVSGCEYSSNFYAVRAGRIHVEYQPPPESPAFRKLQLEKTRSIVILEIEGGDLLRNMGIIQQALLIKGYAVRDVGKTLRALIKMNLAQQDSDSPEMIQKAASLFKDDAAILGRIDEEEKTARIFIELHWIDLKTKKKMWTAKSFYVGSETYENATMDMLKNIFSPLPQAMP